jgi:maleylpyruvate isomerase
MILHGYFRSTASYRVRIVLNLKGIRYDDAIHNLRRGDQNGSDYLSINPQALVPALDVGGEIFTQSLAICEYLDEICPHPPILPAEPIQRARVRAFALVIACDIHPVQNLKILQRLRALGHTEEQVTAWAASTIREGLDACETLASRTPGRFCFGDDVTLADICLVPQLVNARRFGLELAWQRLLAVERACLELDAFRRAAPEQQPDAAP